MTRVWANHATWSQLLRMVLTQNFNDLVDQSLPIIQPHLVGLADRADVAGVVAAVALLPVAGGADPEPDVALVRGARGSGGGGVDGGREGEDGRVRALKVPGVQAEHLVAVPGDPRNMEES